MKYFLSLLILLLLPLTAFAEDKILNIYAWSGEIPDDVIQRFEKETGIHVNFSTYENNEVMYAKLRASPHSGYDIIIPSSYFVDRMRRENMLEPLDKNLLPNWKNINPHFMHLPYDPEAKYSIPLLWGTSGIFYNDQYYSPKDVDKWSDFWEPKFADQLLLLDDVREIFAMAFISMGYPANDRNPEHIKQAYEKIRQIMPNVKVFSSDTVKSILIDEDATVGMVWNGDEFKAQQENPHIHFIYPKEGYLIWVDNLAIPKNPPHKAAAHAFLNFLLEPEIAKEIALYTGFPTGDLAGQKLLPPNIRDNPAIYPSPEVLSHGHFTTDVGDATTALYEKYWEELKMGG